MKKIEHCKDDVYWYDYDLSFEKMYRMCIRHLEKTIRSSMEYDLWARWCKQNDPNSMVCPICGDNYYEKNSKCETHHHPKTLYVIVDDIVSLMIDNNALEKTTAYDIVKQVLDLHMENGVSYINLCVHCHNKYHAGNPDVNDKLYKLFEDKYNEKKLLDNNESLNNYNIKECTAALIKPSFIPAPLPQDVDGGIYEITKFRKD